MGSGPTDKQIRYALLLLGKAGYSTRYMNSKFSELGAGMRARSGTVEAWLRSLSVSDMSKLIDELKLLSSP
jgi:hypothetical protein